MGRSCGLSSVIGSSPIAGLLVWLSTTQNCLTAASPPHSRPIPGSTQVANSGGGFSWQVDDWTRLDRFLILGAEGGTYYITARDLVKQNHDAIVRCIKVDGVRAVKRIAEISDSGRAPKNDPAVLALALVAAHGSPEAKALAFQNLAKVCRSGPHLFHPVQKVYAQGRGEKGSLTWKPVSKIVDALDAAFYATYQNVAPCGKPVLLALDVSGSMDGSMIAGSCLSAREASAAMALVTAATEPDCEIIAFSAGSGGYGGMHGGGESGITRVALSPRMRLDSVIEKVRAIPMGGTDCALPMVWARRNKLALSGFITYTDNSPSPSLTACPSLNRNQSLSSRTNAGSRICAQRHNRG